MTIRSSLGALRSLPDRIQSVVAGQRRIEESLARIAARVEEDSHRRAAFMQAILDDEAGNRRRLWDVRAAPDYDRPFEEATPLVTVYITTYSNAHDLATRALPSVLDQTYDNLEVLVVGDAATPEVEAAVRSFDDHRLHFVNLTIRGPYPEDDVGFWHVAGTAPANEGLRRASGQWIAMNCDDDVFTPNHVELLLAEARSRRLELVYGRIRRLDPDGADIVIGSFPPAPAQFGLQASLFHRGMRIFQHQLTDAIFGDPGDWAWVRRMMRAGVRIGMIDEVVVDYYPSQLWGTPARPRGLLG